MEITPITMEYTPLNYDKLNLLAGTYTPPAVKNIDNDAYKYWERSFFQRALSVIRIDNMPENWHGDVKDFLFWCLFRYGHVAMFNNATYGKSFQPCGLNGFDFYYQPTEAIITNPKLKVTLKIHRDCEILKVCPDYQGIWDIISRYSRRMALIDPALDLAFINAKYNTIMGASTKAGVKFLEKMIDLVNEGKPGIVVDTSILLPNDPVTKEDTIKDYSRKDIKTTYLGTDLLKDYVTVLNQFDSEIGIPTLPYEKKERMVTNEADSKTEDATSRSHVWVNTMNDCFKLINPLLDTNMKAVHNYDDDTEETKETEEQEVDNNE